ncbi:MAG TPA: gamma-glutamyltransferase [Polyangia bacterium]|nr:gamma-glutamyltransferase [Polyangia bacterium]
MISSRASGRLMWIGLFGLVGGGVATAAEPAPAAPSPPSPMMRPAPKRPFRAARAVVASDHPLASAAGVTVLKAGGNAFDAACATALALGVLHPDASGIGGGGFALAYVAKQKKVYALDFRERAPAALTAASFLKNGKAVESASKEGGLAVGVPGEVRGLAELVKRWGAKPWKTCVDPAQKLAAKGIPVSWRLAKSFETLDAGPAPADPTFTKMFVSAKPPAEGSIFPRPELAATLATLENDGPDAFYKGPIADEIVKAVKAAGGVLTAQDLTDYAPTERAPLQTTHRGLSVYTMPPPSSGGVALVETLGILDHLYAKPAALPKGGRQSPEYLHALTEALKNAFADRARFLGDPDFVSVDVARLTSGDYAAQLAARVKADGVLPNDAYGSLGTPPKAPPKDGGTTHLSIIDAAGNAVALTTTVNLSFGAKLVAGSTGIVLNDQMDDFVLQVGVPNSFGLIGNEQNAVAPKKRPLSSMTPTIVLDDKAKNKVKLVVGGAGGPNIITATIEVLLDVLDWKMDAQAALSSPRIHHQWFPDALAVEPGVPKDAVDALAKRGHKTKDIPAVGKVNLVVRTPRGLESGAEPRSPSGPAGY